MDVLEDDVKDGVPLTTLFIDCCVLSALIHFVLLSSCSPSTPQPTPNTSLAHPTPPLLSSIITFSFPWEKSNFVEK